MAIIASSSTTLTPITATNGSGNVGSTSFIFNDVHGSAFTMSQSSGYYGYQGLRTNAQYKYFRMTYEWKGSAGGSYLGSFWGNTSATDIWGGSSTGYKTAQYPQSSGTNFSVHLRNTNTNTDRDVSGPLAGFSQTDGNWHTTVVEVKPDCVRVSVDGVEMLSSLLNATRPIVSTVGDEIAKKGYCGILFYAGTFEIKNFKVEPIELPNNWEHFATYTNSVSSSSIDMLGILNRNEADYHTIKLVIERIKGDSNGNEELYIQFTNDSGTSYTASYYGNIHEVSYASASPLLVASTNNGSQGTLWVDNWESVSGGCHGEVMIYNFGVDDFAINNNDVNKGSYYRPILYSTLVGYDRDTGYCRQDANLRYNADRAANDYSGVKLYYSSGNVSPDYIIHVYGQRGPRA